MDAPDRHDTMVEATALAQTNEYESYHQGVVICSYLIVAVVACIAARDVAFHASPPPPPSSVVVVVGDPDPSSPPHAIADDTRM